jgi:hypothetical protein
LIHFIWALVCHEILTQDQSLQGRSFASISDKVKNKDRIAILATTDQDPSDDKKNFRGNSPIFKLKAEETLT